jgi:hypothetical protein
MAVILDQLKGGKTNLRFKITVGDGETSEWHLIPSGIGILTVDFLPSGRAKVQTSNDVEGIIAGNATPIEWDHGASTADIASRCDGIRGIRLVSVTGACDLIVNGVQS